MWHLVFLAFFAFSVIRFAIYLSERRLYPPHYRSQLPMSRTTYDPNHRRNAGDLHDLSGELRGETEKAWRFYDGKETVWLPKSQCEWDPDSKTMTVPEWLAQEKGLI